MQLDRIAVGIFDQDLFAARTRLCLVSKAHASLLEGGDLTGEIVHGEHDTIPTARLLPSAVGHRSRSGAAGAAQDEAKVSAADIGESGAALHPGLEREPLGVEGDGSFDVAHLVADGDL